MSGRLEAIWIKRMRRGPMDPVDTAALEANQGLTGNANRGGWRQVTIISKEAWDSVCKELDAAIDPALRRANLMVSGVDLAHSRDKTLAIGGVRIKLVGETSPCNLMDEQHPGLQETLRSEWRGGAFGFVVDDGKISVGDPAVWVDNAD